MAKFTKYNNPNKKRKHYGQKHSAQYMEERRNELYKILGSCKTDEERDNVIKAYHITLNP